MRNLSYDVYLFAVYESVTTFIEAFTLALRANVTSLTLSVERQLCVIAMRYSAKEMLMVLLDNATRPQSRQSKPYAVNT